MPHSADIIGLALRGRCSFEEIRMSADPVIKLPGRMATGLGVGAWGGIQGSSSTSEADVGVRKMSPGIMVPLLKKKKKIVEGSGGAKRRQQRKETPPPAAGGLQRETGTEASPPRVQTSTPPLCALTRWPPAALSDHFNSILLGGPLIGFRGADAFVCPVLFVHTSSCK